MIFKIDKDCFVERLLSPASKLSDNLHLVLEKNFIKTFVCSADNSTILNVRLPCQNEETGECIIPDCKTFLRLFSSIEQSSIQLNISNNSIEFNGEKIKFKYHLLDDAYASNKRSMNEDKLNKLTFDTTFRINKRGLSEICKFNSIIPDAEKLYFFTESKEVYAKIGDDQRSNTNELTTHISREFRGTEMSQCFPINVQNILLMSFADNDIDVSVNHQLKIFKFSCTTSFYIVSGLVK